MRVNWTDRSTGEILESFTVLTINADGHPVMGRFHRPGDEKRSLVVVPPDAWDNWLAATAARALEMLVDMPVAEFESAPSISETTLPQQASLI